MWIRVLEWLTVIFLHKVGRKMKVALGDTESIPQDEVEEDLC